MTPEQEADIRARHVMDYDYRCVCGGSPQVEKPCDTDIVLTALGEARAGLAAEKRQYGVSMKAMLAERDAARAERDAARAELAEAQKKEADRQPDFTFYRVATPDPAPHRFRPRLRGVIGSPCVVCGDTPFGRAHEAQKEGAK